MVWGYFEFDFGSLVGFLTFASETNKQSAGCSHEMELEVGLLPSF